jgi:hypothetical protein
MFLATAYYLIATVFAAGEKHKSYWLGIRYDICLLIKVVIVLGIYLPYLSQR